MDKARDGEVEVDKKTATRKISQTAQVTERVVKKKILGHKSNDGFLTGQDSSILTAIIKPNNII